MFLTFLIKNDENSLLECGFSNKVFNRLYEEFKKVLLEQNELYLDYIKDKEQSSFKKISNN